jgi:hypothetical protein
MIFEYLHKFETEFENNLGCESGAYQRSVHEKIQRPKSRATALLKPLSDTTVESLADSLIGVVPHILRTIQISF